MVLETSVWLSNSKTKHRSCNWSVSKRGLKDNINELHIVAKGLLEYETLSGQEINDLVKGIKPNRDDFDDNDSSPEPTIATSIPKTSNTVHPQTN